MHNNPLPSDSLEFEDRIHRADPFHPDAKRYHDFLCQTEEPEPPSPKRNGKTRRKRKRLWAWQKAIRQRRQEQRRLAKAGK